MRLEYYPLEKLKKEILEAVGKRLDLNIYKVFFFGSRVSGKGTDRSDVDIGIKGEKYVPSSIFYDIQEDVENIPTLYKLEIVDFNKVSPKFREVAEQHIEFLN